MYSLYIAICFFCPLVSLVAVDWKDNWRDLFAGGCLLVVLSRGCLVSRQCLSDTVQRVPNKIQPEMAECSPPIWKLLVIAFGKYMTSRGPRTLWWERRTYQPTDSGDTKVGAKDAYASKKIVLQSPELIGKKASIISRQPSASPPHPDLHWCVSSVAAPVLNASRTPVVIRQTPRARHLSRAPGLI